MISTYYYCSFCGAANPTKSILCFACHQPLHEVDEEALYTKLLNGRYRIVECVGVGGFGAVYRAEDQQLSHVVAIKQIRLHGLSSQQKIDATDTFNREVALLSGLSHPHLPRFYTHFSDADNWYLVMEFIEGETLDAYLVQHGQAARQRVFSFDGVLDVGLQLCDVLQYLHTRQPAIIFRDLKPGNIMRTSTGQLYLIDFGISRRFTPGKQRDTIPLGSPGYASPEQYGKAQTTPQADIYSLGALLHCLLTGNDPADNPFHFASSYAYGNLGVNELNTLILRMVEREASQRPASILEVKQTLERIVLQHTNWQSPVRKKVPLPVVGNSNTYTPNSNGSGPGNYATNQQQQQMYKPLSQQSLKSPTRRKTLVGLGILGLTFIVGTEVFSAFHHAEGISVDPEPQGSNSTQQDQSTSAPISGIQALVTYQGHKDTVVGVHWSNDGQTITSIDQFVTQIWNTKTATTITTYTFGYPYLIESDFAWSPDGTQIATFTSEISIWQLATGQNVLNYSQLTSSINLLAWSPDGKYIAEGGLDQHVRVWEAATGNSITDYAAHTASVNSLAWSPDSTLLFSGDYHGNMNVWNASNGQTLQNYKWYQTVIAQAAWSPDGKQIAWQTANGQVQVWRTLYDEAPVDKVPAGGSSKQLVWSPDSKYIATTSDSIVRITNVQDSSIFVEYHGHTDIVHAVEWSPDGKYIASAGQDQTVQIWQPFSA